MSGLPIIDTLHRANQLAALVWGKCADAAGCGETTVSQAVVIDAIERLSVDGAYPSQTALVDITNIDRSTMADIVRRLLKRGLISRKRTKEDARRYAVRLTDDGETESKRCRRAYSAAVVQLTRLVGGIDGLSISDAPDPRQKRGSASRATAA